MTITDKDPSTSVFGMDTRQKLHLHPWRHRSAWLYNTVGLSLFGSGSFDEVLSGVAPKLLEIKSAVPENDNEVDLDETPSKMNRGYLQKHSS